jgi:hypothetical protein
MAPAIRKAYMYMKELDDVTLELSAEEIKAKQQHVFKSFKDLVGMVKNKLDSLPYLLLLQLLT